MKILQDLEDVRLACIGWKLISAKMKARPGYSPHAILIIPPLPTTPLSIKPFCRIQHEQLRQLLAVASMQEVLKAIPPEDQFSWKAIAASKSQNLGPTRLADLDPASAPAILGTQLRHVWSSLQQLTKRETLCLFGVFAQCGGSWIVDLGS
jgi:hypothetical protein